MKEYICQECGKICTKDFRFKKGHKGDDTYHPIPILDSINECFTIICQGCLQWSRDNRFCSRCGEISPSCGFIKSSKIKYSPLCVTCNNILLTDATEEGCGMSRQHFTKFMKCKYCKRLCPYSYIDFNLRIDKYPEQFYHNIKNIGIICHICFIERGMTKYCMSCGTFQPRIGWYYNCLLADRCIECEILIYRKFNVDISYCIGRNLDIICRKCKIVCSRLFSLEYKQINDNNYHIKIAKENRKRIHIYCQGCLKWTEKKPYCYNCGLRRPKSGWNKYRCLTDKKLRYCNHCFNNMLFFHL